MIAEIIHAFTEGTKKLEDVIENLNDFELYFQPNKGVNHIAWNVGHLVCSFQAIGEEMNIPQWLSSDFVDLFGQGSRLHKNKDRYPKKAELLDALLDGKKRVLEKLEKISPKEIAGQLPDEWFRDLFPTLGDAVLNTLVTHFALHYGYICAVQKMAKASKNSIKTDRPRTAPDA